LPIVISFIAAPFVMYFLRPAVNPCEEANTFVERNLHRICFFFSKISKCPYTFWYPNRTDFSFKDDNLTMTAISLLLWICSIFYQICITKHIWHEPAEGIVYNRKLFVNLSYNAILIDLSLALSRRRMSIRQYNKGKCLTFLYWSIRILMN